MNQESQDNTPERDEGPAATPPAVLPPEPQPGPVRTGTGGLLAGLALLGVIAAAAGGYYLWQQLGLLRQSLDEKAISIANAESGWKTRSDVLGQELEAARSAQQSLQAEIETLREQRGARDSDWSVTDVEYLLRIAHHRLMLQQDVNGALAALTAADQRLLEIDDPRLLVVRERLAADITALRAVPVLDREGMALTLVSLAERSDQLPLVSAHARPVQPAADATEVTGDAGTWRTLLANVWQELQRLVVVRRKAEGAAPMLAPQQQYFLRQNLRLQLEAARVALLRGDNPNYSASLETAHAWLGRHFDATDAGVNAARKQLEELATAKLNPVLPDISGTLSLMRERVRQPAGSNPAHNGRAAL